MATIVLHGTSISGLLQGVIVRPLSFPTRATIDPRDPKRGGRFRIGAGSAPPDYDIVLGSSSSTQQVSATVNDALLQFRGAAFGSDNLFLDPQLASSWSVSTDATTFTFNLRKDVKFQNVPPVNGRRFTSADVKWSFELYAKIGWQQSIFQAITQIQTPDDYTIVLKLARPDPGFLVTMSEQTRSILAKEVYDQDGNFKTRAVGLGPFILKEDVRDVRISMDANPDYYENDPLGRKMPFVGGVDYLTIPDAAARSASLRTKQVEYIISAANTSSEAKSLAKVSGLLVYASSAPNTPYLVGMRLDKAPFDNVDVRRALSLAIDRDGMMQAAFEGAASNLPTWPWIWAFDKAPTAEDLGPWFKYDQAQARQLLQKAGVTNLKLTMPYFEFGSYITPMAEIIQSGWKAVGVDLTLQKLTQASFNTQLVNASFETVLFAHDFPRVISPTSYFPLRLRSNGSANRSYIKNPEIDRLTDDIAVTADPAKSKQLARQIWNIEVDQMYRIQLPWGVSFSAWPDYVKNFGEPWYQSGPGSGSRNWKYVWLDK